MANFNANQSCSVALVSPCDLFCSFCPHNAPKLEKMEQQQIECFEINKIKMGKKIKKMFNSHSQILKVENTQF